MTNEEKYRKQFQEVTAGLDLTDSEKRTLNWLAGMEYLTAENVISIIIKARAK